MPWRGSALSMENTMQPDLPSPTESPFKVALTSANFEALLTVESFQRPVVIDFWADWCAPCKMLMPILDKLADECQGQFILATLDTEAEPQLAAQFGVRNLPTVAVIRSGKPVDHFSGALPESEIRAFLAKHLPNAWDADIQTALMLMESDQVLEALVPAHTAYELSGQQPEIACFYARILLLNHRLDECKAVLANIRLADQDDGYHTVMAQLELAEQAAEAPEIQECLDRLAQSPDDLLLHMELAVQYQQQNRNREALELMMTVLRKDKNFQDGGARKTFLEMLQSLAKGDPLAVEFQRQFFSLLY